MMRREETEEPFDPQQYVGMVLVGIGSLALLYVVISVIQIIRNPDDAGLVTWVMKTVGGKDAVFGGVIGEEKFEFHASEALQYMFLAIVGLIVLRLVTAIFMTFIKEGTALMVLANQRQQERNVLRNLQESKKVGPPSLPGH